MTNNKISNEREEEIVASITKGHSFKRLVEEFGHTYKVFLRVASSHGVKEQFLDNNRKQVSSSTKMRMKREVTLRYLKYDKQNGDFIEKKINQGAHLSKLMREVQKSQAFIKKFVKWKSDSLYEIMRLNGERILQENRVKNSLKGADKVRGIVKRSATKQETKSCKDLIEKGYHLAEIQRRTNIPSGRLKMIFDSIGLHPMKCNQSGAGNPMYGKTPSKKSGIGTKCWFFDGEARHFCRSSLELKVYLTLKEEGKSFNVSKRRITYVDKDKINRTYCPDVEYDGYVCEIKPKALLAHGNNPLKFREAKKTFKAEGVEFKIITEDTFDLTWISKDVIMEKINEGLIKIDENNREKLWRNL